MQKNNHPVKLLVGDPQALNVLLFEELKALFSLTPDSAHLSLMREKRHPALRWIVPSGNLYRKDDLETVFEETHTQRTDADKLVFIFERADLLNDACANRLLKIVEEPPQGIYFFFLTPRREFVITTLASRALVLTTLADTHTAAQSHPLVELLKKAERPAHAYLTQALEKQPPSEQETKFLLDELQVFWTNTWRTALEKGDLNTQKNAERILKVITYGYDRLPMPGSSKYFWRTIFLLLENPS